jgi:hypothetical protein
MEMPLLDDNLIGLPVIPSIEDDDAHGACRHVLIDSLRCVSRVRSCGWVLSVALRVSAAAASPAVDSDAEGSQRNRRKSQSTLMSQLHTRALSPQVHHLVEKDPSRPSSRVASPLVDGGTHSALNSPSRLDEVAHVSFASRFEDVSAGTSADADGDAGGVGAGAEVPVGDTVPGSEGGDAAAAAAGEQTAVVEQAAPTGWWLVASDDGVQYYYDYSTGMSSLQRPEGVVVANEPAPPVLYYDQDGTLLYYYPDAQAFYTADGSVYTLVEGMQLTPAEGYGYTAEQAQPQQPGDGDGDGGVAVGDDAVLSLPVGIAVASDAAAHGGDALAADAAGDEHTAAHGGENDDGGGGDDGSVHGSSADEYGVEEEEEEEEEEDEDEYEEHYEQDEAADAAHDDGHVVDGDRAGADGRSSAGAVDSVAAAVDADATVPAAAPQPAPGAFAFYNPKAVAASRGGAPPAAAAPSAPSTASRNSLPMANSTLGGAGVGGAGGSAAASVASSRRSSAADLHAADVGTGSCPPRTPTPGVL